MHRVGCHKWTSDTVVNVSQHVRLHVRCAKMIRTIATQQPTIAQYHATVHYQVCRREDAHYNSSTSSREHAPTSPAAVAPPSFPDTAAAMTARQADASFPNTATIVRVLKYNRQSGHNSTPRFCVRNYNRRVLGLPESLQPFSKLPRARLDTARDIT